MTIVLALMGLSCVGYGVTVMTLNSGTLFFAVWYVLGAALLVGAGALHAGVWQAAPMLLRRGVLAVLVAGLALLVGTQALILSGMGAKGELALDYVVVLGAQIYRDGSPSPVLQYRLDAALEYLRENPDTRCIVSGGQGPNEPCSEAQGMADYLVRQGVAAERIIQEGRSTTTLQNVTYSMALMEGDSPHVGVVTNNFHVYRAVRLARKAGLANACGIAAYSTPWYLPNNLLRESLGLVKDFVAGNI